MGGAQLDGLAVGRAAVGFGPGFLARQQSCGVGQLLGRYQTFKGREPMMIVARAVVGLASTGGRFDFIRESRCPFLPGEMPLLGELDGERERLSLPRLGKYGPSLVAG